ncbi:MAG: hypothetical protein FIA92_03885 [Chloroflexi bacterium]|nr:hypothetical protein [Chloroflexota bacterium]
MPMFDQHIGPMLSPSVEVNPIDGTVDLVWSSRMAPARIVMSLASVEELQQLIRNAIEAVQREHARTAATTPA